MVFDNVFRRIILVYFWCTFFCFLQPQHILASILHTSQSKVSSLPSTQFQPAVENRKILFQVSRLLGFLGNRSNGRIKNSPLAFQHQLLLKTLSVMPHCLGMSYYVNFLGGLGSNRFHTKRRFGTHGSSKKSKSWGPFWSYRLNSPQDFNFFNCTGCRICIFCEIRCYLCPPKVDIIINS
jgi:hypothetical protein